MRWVKWVRLLFIIGLLLALGFGLYFALQLFEKQEHSYNDENQYIYIPSGARLSLFMTDIMAHPLVKEPRIFERTARLLNFRENNLRPGRYKVPNSYSYFSLIQMLKKGEQSPLNLVLNNERTIEELAEKVSRYLEPDKIEFQNFFYQVNSLDTLQIAPEEIMTYMIPNTYQFLWNTGPDQFLQRMVKEHQKFWDKENRRQKAQNLQMSPKEVYILASIVEKETRVKEERPRVAGLYINRLNEKMKLQADPTVVFAIGDFSINRVLYHHLQFDSPYNTYIHEGLPPGPIGMASINSIDAVLNAEEHDYIYMCAKPDLNGGHLFAKNYNEHLKNAAIYRDWLSKYLREKDRQQASNSGR
jgi:UPF0755 protein